MHWTQLTRSQGGLIGRRQLRAVGLARDEIDALLRSERLERTRAAGVYRAAGAPSTAATRSWFAVLSTDSPLSYVSAAAWWGMSATSDDLVHITRLDRRRLDWPAGVRVHRVGLEGSAITQCRGLPVTTRVETALDCAGWLPPGQARAFADRALQQRWMTLGDVATRLETQPGRWGNRQLRRLLSHGGDGAAAESERRLHRLLRQARVTGWVANLPFVTPYATYAIDVAFPEQKIAIEIDGYEYHSKQGRFQTDRTKQNALIAAGWRILRFTWADLEQRPWLVIGQITALLAA